MTAVELQRQTCSKIAVFAGAREIAIILIKSSVVDLLIIFIDDRIGSAVSKNY